MTLTKNIPSRKKTTATTWSTSCSSVESQQNTLNFDDLDFNNTVHYLESGTSQLERDESIMSPCTFEELSIAGFRYIICHDNKIDIEEELESANLLIDMKHQQNDSKSNLEKETKNLQIEEQNAMIDEERSSVLQSLAEYKEFAKEDEDSNEKDVRLKALPNAMKRQEKKRIDSVISRVLCVSWKKLTRKGIFLPRTAAAYMQRKGLHNFDYMNLLIDQALVEILFMFATWQDPLQNITVIDISFDCNGSQASPPVTSPFYESPISTSLLAGSNSPQSKCLNYLLNCYSRIATEKKNHPKRVRGSLVSDVLTILRKKCVEYSSLVLKGLVGKCQGVDIPMYTTHLLYPILAQRLPDGYLHELMATTYTNPSIFNQIFTPVLQGLFLLMQQASLVGNTHRRPIRALRELIEICCGPSNNIRPICSLIINQIQFLPNVVTSIAGRELTTNSFLGPFLSVSIFTEEVAEKFFSDDFVMNKSMILTLQQELQSTRKSLYKIFDAILANKECRDAILEYLTVLLHYNEKRAQIQMKEDALSLAEDGFMLNLLSILQMLSMKIELDTVDPLYPFNSSTFIEIKKDTRLKLTLQEAAEWQKHLESTHKRMKPTFSTKCWFLTLHCHHIALLPALRTYREKLRDLQEEQKKFDEYQIQREDNFLTDLKDFVKQQWMQELKKLIKSKSCAEAGLIDSIFLKRCFHFYASVAEVLLSILTQTAPGSPLPELPLPQEITRNFAALPEWYIGDIVEFLLFTFEFCPEAVENNMDNSLITLFLVIMCTPDCIRNPYLFAQIIEVFVDMYLNSEGKMETLYSKVMAHSISKTSLASYLMKFYIDIDCDIECKFEIRNDICTILKSLWNSPMHRVSIVNESNNGKHFVEFIDKMMNDITFLIQKGLEFLTLVCKMEDLMSDTVDPIAWTALSQEQQQLNTKQLVAEKALHFLKFANDTLDIFHYLIVDIKKPFLQPELVEQLCTMLNFNEQKFCSFVYENSKVKQLLEFWKLLSTLSRKLIDIYLHLDCDIFAAALANTNHPFCKLFIYAASKLREESPTKTSNSHMKKKINMFITLVERMIMRDNAQRESARKLDYDNASEKLHCPLMDIQDPVKPPCTIMDKAMITRNPFETIRMINENFRVQKLWRCRLQCIIQDPVVLSSAIMDKAVIIGNSIDNATDE